jgi:hypothetical protein
MPLWNKSEAKLGVICDIGSASVSIGLLLLRNGEKPKVLFSNHFPITIQETPKTETLEPVMLSFLEDALKSLVVSGQTRKYDLGLRLHRFEFVNLIYSSPWYVSRTETIQIKKEKPFVLKLSEVEALMDSEEKKFEDRALGGKYENVVQKDIVMVERELVKVKLNGYETNNPYDKKASVAELSIYMSLIPHSVHQKVEALIDRYLHTTKIRSFTFPLVSFASVRLLYPHELNYVLLDITGENTDVSYVENGVIIGSSSFNIGRNHLVRTTARKLATTTDIAFSSIAMFESGGLESGLHSDIEAMINEFGAKWTEELDLALKRFSVTLPMKKIFLTSGEEARGIFIKHLEGLKSTQGAFSIMPLTPNLFLEKIEYDKFVMQDPFIALESLFLSLYPFKI